jgi:hypothetical protein
MLTTLPSEAPREQLLDVLEQDGGVIVEGFWSPERADRLRADFEPHLGAVGWSNAGGGDPNAFFGFKTKRLHGLLARSAGFGELITDPRLVELAERQLGPRCRGVRISTGELMALGRDETEQPLHRDADSWPFIPAPRPPILFSATLALTEFSQENGATVLAPGSHRWTRERKPAPEETTQAVMAKGSVLLYDGDVIHGGGANRTSQSRIGCYVGYLVSWLRPLEDPLITVGADVLRAAPAAAQSLLGFNETGWEVIP